MPINRFRTLHTARAVTAIILENRGRFLKIPPRAKGSHCRSRMHHPRSPIMVQGRLHCPVPRIECAAITLVLPRQRRADEPKEAGAARAEWRTPRYDRPPPGGRMSAEQPPANHKAAATRAPFAHLQPSRPNSKKASSRLPSIIAMNPAAGRMVDGGRRAFPAEPPGDTVRQRRADARAPEEAASSG
jgi:hypothetical protein